MLGPTFLSYIICDLQWAWCHPRKLLLFQFVDFVEQDHRRPDRLHFLPATDPKRSIFRHHPTMDQIALLLMLCQSKPPIGCRDETNEMRRSVIGQSLSCFSRCRLLQQHSYRITTRHIVTQFCTVRYDFGSFFLAISHKPAVSCQLCRVEIIAWNYPNTIDIKISRYDVVQLPKNRVFIEPFYVVCWTIVACKFAFLRTEPIFATSKYINQT